VWAQGFSRDQFDRTPELVFQQEGKGHKVIKRLFARDEFDQKVYVALAVGLLSLKRSEQADPFHTEPSQIVSVMPEALDHVLSSSDCIHHINK
jgi:hypothetical protein